MGRAGPPPPPPPDPLSSDPLPHPTSLPSSDPQAPSSDLVRSGPDLTVFSSFAGQSSSGHCQSPCQQASAPPAAAGSSSGISAQPLLIPPATRASELAAAGPDLVAAGSSSGHSSSAEVLPLQPSRQPASSSPRSSCLAADRAAADSISAAFRDPSNSDLSHPQITSVLPLLASVLRPPATSSTSPSSSSLPPPSQTATLQAPYLGSSMECSKVSLDTPHFSAVSQNPAPIGSTPGVRFNASTNQISANPLNYIPSPSNLLPHLTVSSDPFPPLPHSQPSPPPQHLPLPLPPPLHPPSSLSYAQAAKHPRGSGFVRSHAADVESFARLPRTGANIICGSKEGIPSFSFVHSDLQTVENLYSNALIMKFYGGRPSLEVSHREIQSWGLEHSFSIGPLSSRAFLLRFKDNQDLIRVLSRPSSILITFPYKIFRWHNLCHLKDDSCYAPVWISLPRLPLQCFIPEFLEAVANRIGRFLCFDKATTTLARPSAARLCVELDLRVTPPPFIWVGLFDGLKQPIIYEKMPKFCGECHIQGHLISNCPKDQRETPNIQHFPRSMMNQARPPHVRQNVAKQVSAIQPNSIAASPPNSHPPPPPNPPSTSVLFDAVERASDAATAQPTAALLQQAPQQSAGLLQQAAAAAGPAVHTQPTDTQLQHDPAAAEPSTGLDPPPQSASPVQRASVSAAPPAASSAEIDPALQPAAPVQRVSVSAAPSLPPADPSAISAHSSGLMDSTMTHPPPPHKSSTLLKGKHKSIKTKPPDVGTSSSLNQQQQEALELFKSKVRGQSQIRNHQPSVNHFEVLRYDHSDADGEDASYYSDTDDGCVEHIDLGYQSAYGRSSNKHKDFTPSGMRTNKRHPNMPLRVKLRSRKNPSTP